MSYEKQFGLPRVRVVSLSEGPVARSIHHIPLPEATCTITAGSNLVTNILISDDIHLLQEFDTDLLRIAYTSPFTPECTYDYNMRTQELKLLRDLKLASMDYSAFNLAIGSFNKSGRSSFCLFGPAHDKPT